MIWRRGADLSLLLNLLKHSKQCPNIFAANHKNICNVAGVPFKTYRYYSREQNQLDFQGMCDDLKAAPAGSVILLHACAHNPTGMDPTPEQWDVLENIIKEGKLFPFFDCAYQGFASGDLDRDVAPVRTFVARGHEMLVGQSFAKNLGLYCMRYIRVELNTS